MSDLYQNVRASVDDKELSRVETNQRALIDKILARYATVNAVYRELLQNSNDANATTAEIFFTVEENMVTQVIYRNNGMPFRPEDWSRLQKIAEGNPNPAKVGAFGVGAYTMFSICEEPLVLSGSQALAFVWRGDALYTQTADQPKSTKWTSFVLPSRDPYPLPNMSDFAQFLCASLTFTKSLKEVRVLVNDKQRCMIVKVMVQEPRIVQAPKSKSSWWSSSSDSVTTSTSLFSLTQKESISETVYRITVSLDEDVGFTDARIVSAVAACKVPTKLKARMERVTKKSPPKNVNIELFLNAHDGAEDSNSNAAQRICQSLAPAPGAGRIFIGFPTSQTTGLAAHVSAPFAPTVEREAMDLQDAALRQFNTELLHLAGIVLRLTLDHTFAVLQTEWIRTAETREALEKKLEKEQLAKKSTADAPVVDSQPTETAVEDESESSTSRSLMGFAKFMAKSAKKKIVTVVSSTVEQFNEGHSLLNPVDARPLCKEERLAILLMQSYCPQQSTPDYTVGAAIAQGFGSCMNSPAPVLTRGGVVRGDIARLPHFGMQAFCGEHVVRKVVYENCREYHAVIAQCRPLNWDDLIKSVSGTTMEESKAIRLVQWWTKYSRVEKSATAANGLNLKDAIVFSPENGTKESSVTIALRDFLFYVDDGSLLKAQKVPETVIPTVIQRKLTLSTLKDSSVRLWFEHLPIEIWADFICNDPIMKDGKKADEESRIQILTILHQTYQQRYGSEKAVFGNFVKKLVTGVQCIPFDSKESNGLQLFASCPEDLYLYSAEIAPFEGLGTFRKVAKSLKAAGITEEFLLALGVRKSVAIDFLFTNLDSLKWNSDPKPLIEYLRTATLTRDDALKLTQTRYLPAENDSKTYAPSELYLPSEGLRALSFVKMLNWPSEPEISERSVTGKFLVKLGVKVRPPLVDILSFITEQVASGHEPSRYLDFLVERLGPKGDFYAEYARLGPSLKKKYKILPCTVHVAFGSMPPETLYYSPVTCFSDAGAGIMGVPVIDATKLGANAKRYGEAFNCDHEPDTHILLHQLFQLVALAKRTQKAGRYSSEDCNTIEATFAAVFLYLSHRSSDFDTTQLNRLKNEEIIPCRVGESIEWFKAEQVFFRKDKEGGDSLTGELFQMVAFSPFLAAIGVKQEASSKDLFELMLVSPEKVLAALGSEKKYRGLLRRIAANPPFSRLSPQIRKSPFLLAYKISDTDEKKGDTVVSNFELACAEEIYIVDNSFFGRMFPVKHAPHESDLEDFYIALGSRYISKSVQRRFEVTGKEQTGTRAVQSLRERVLERSPLLVSPSVTSRPLVSNASSIMEGKSLDFVQAPSIMAVYSLQGVIRRTRTTCFSRQVGRTGGRHAIYVTEKFDWFDVGFAIGDIILQRCQLEDAFFISSLLEAPLEQLRTRGFPVDRILSRPEPEVPKRPEPQAKPSLLSIEKSPKMPANAIANTAGTTSIEDKLVAPATVKKSAPPPPSTAPSPPPTTKAANHNTSTNRGDKKPPNKSLGTQQDDIRQILHQMFPDADDEYIRKKLGPNPSLEDVRRLAEDMALGDYPTKDTVSQATESSSIASNEPPKKAKKGIRKKLGSAFGFRGPNGGAMNGLVKGGGGAAAPPTSVQETRHNVSPAEDAQSHKRLEQVLAHTVKQSSSSVNRAGVHSETQVTSIPQELDHSCEVIPSQSLIPWKRDGQAVVTHNGIRVFGTLGNPTTLLEDASLVEDFSVVLGRLADVFGSKMNTLAIFYDPNGGTIAFNLGGALYFNLRFYHALHASEGNPAACLSYWFVTMAHELSHNLVSAHNKEHGFYTESYVTTYLPKLVELLGDL